jgi:hypothetical protein
VGIGKRLLNGDAREPSTVNAAIKVGDAHGNLHAALMSTLSRGRRSTAAKRAGEPLLLAVLPLDIGDVVAHDRNGVAHARNLVRETAVR